MRLTSAQKQLYNLEIFAGESIGIICGTVLFDKIYDIDEMKNAINEVFRINESLRTRIKLENGKPVQYVTEYIEQNIKVFNFNTKDEVHKFADKMAHTPFDFAGNLCELGILISENFCGVIYRLHHIISDGWTLALIASQFYKILHKEPVEAFPYSSYLEEEEKYLQSKRASKDKEYFIEQYHKIDEPVYLLDTAPKIGESIRKSYIIDKSKTSRIMEYVEKENTTAYTFFLTLISTYFSKIKNNAEKFFIGTTVLNRTTHTHRNTAGIFVNTVPFLAEMDNEGNFATNMKKTEENIFCLFRHQKYNYVDMLSDIGEDRLFDIIFSYQNNTIYGDHSLSTWYHNGMQNESLQIHIDDRDSNGVFRIHYDYQTEKFSEGDIDVMHKRLLTIIQDILDSNNKQICKLEYLTKEEKETILKNFNCTEHSYNIPENSTLYSLFEGVAEANEDKVCLKTDGKEISFSEFKEKVEVLDCRIREITENKKSIVAIICERSFEMYSAIYGIIRGGNAYLPIDPDYPRDRIDYILENSNAALVVAQDKFTHLAGKVSCINMTNIVNDPTEDLHIPPCAASEDDTAYVIYTSGSTGKPKGAKVSHKSAVNRILWMHDKYPLLPDDVILQKTPYTFDVSVWEHFWWGIVGGCLAPSKPGEHFLPAKILEEVFNNKVTHLHFVPSVFELFLNYLESHKDECFKFNTVKYVFLSGEALSANLIKRFYDLFDFNKVTLHNLYGPTECAVDVTYYDCSPADIDPVPIGKPIYNTQMYVVDKYMKPTPIGVTGELCICGVNVGQGYLNNPELTAEKFIDNPFGEGKLYKTGDLAYWREDGNIGFVGRNDFQIKIHGQRIELGEIENAIASVDGVIQSAVVVRKDNNDGQFICAFYTGDEKSAQEIKSIIGTNLPKYMVPHIFCHLDEMPLTSSGKISRSALPEIDFTSISIETEYVSAETPEEKALSNIICSVLKTDRINMLDNFFNIGGDSIKAIYVVSELEEIGFELHVADIMQNDTLSDIAKTMKATSAKVIYDQNEVNGFIPFTPIMRAYIAETAEIQKDFVHNCIISVDCDESITRKALDALVSHHDILRGTLTDNGIEIHPSNEREVYSFKEITIDDTEKAKEFLNKTNVDNNKLINVVFCNTEKENLLSITIHHFLIDLVSWEILIKDFITVVNQLKNNEQISLPAKTASFKLWNDKLQKYSETISEANKEYWKNISTILDNTKSLNSRNETINEAEHFSFTFDKNISDKLINEANTTYGTRTNEILLTALGLAAGKIADSSVGILVESYGRADLHKTITIKHTIGWFTSCYPVVINNNNNATEELINTKETLRRIPNNGIDYLLLSQGFHNNTDIIFNFYKTSLAEETGGNQSIAFGEICVFPGKINVNCLDIDDILTIEISVPECKHKLNICEELGIEFIKQIETLVDICTTTDTITKTRSDFSDDELTESELDELIDLFDWTDGNE